MQKVEEMKSEQEHCTNEIPNKEPLMTKFIGHLEKIIPPPTNMHEFLQRESTFKFHFTLVQSSQGNLHFNENLGVSKMEDIYFPIST